MGFLSVLSFAHKQIEARMQPGSMAIDMTAGTGADTLLLARLAGPRGHIYCVDVQEQALQLTRNRLAREQQERLAPVTYLHGSHASITEMLPEKVIGHISAITFNLGYLPVEGADQRIITQPDSTVTALEQTLHLLQPKGIATVVLYPGHSGGKSEAEAVTAWAKSLPPHAARSIIYRQLQREDAPYVIAIEKK